MSSVAAVIVTWNRKELLRQCLTAVRAQTRPLDAIIVIDNASTDGTSELLAAEGFLADPRLRLVRMSENLGGAGGFAAGIHLARSAGYDWLWLMDDDTIPTPTALAYLMRVADKPWRHPPALLASRVEWRDGTLHPMNRVKPLRGHHPRPGVFAIRACSFVSCLVRGTIVDAVGLPIAAYRLWMDDVEYTHRLCRRHPGIAVPTSVVEHRTAAAASVFAAPPDRLAIMVRNWLWMLRFSSALRAGERLGSTIRAVYTISRALIARPSTARIAAVMSGWRAGWRLPA